MIRTKLLSVKGMDYLKSVETKHVTMQKFWDDVEPQLQATFKLTHEELGCVALFMLGFFYHSGSPDRVVQKVVSDLELYTVPEGYKVPFLSKTYQFSRETWNRFNFSRELSDFLGRMSHSHFRVNAKSLLHLTPGERAVTYDQLLTSIYEKVRKSS